ncbi:putative CRISPR-associated protein (uncharacterized protein, predicted to be involved in DNA repair) [Desulforapulum autotrophicum HRM2]|uniref:CRISPR-associated endonuclease Cas1 n=1 Tax=Desulforapulum autotrophicum (strain ATCC 43914 / DSM 3382 / VKM B-1955 / HRM2) TaxID=177437 RepID=C0QHV1_DESAH|nr:CRISPR-associated endonuclease Cas1 [Desulforapulum autotrophicum]ACN13659.1 putative CRISPR-associated protein (uncharacterized protein, predicted to be involved in DNA repair) [Desulforapulum autotrophicum HRM2]
MQVYIHSPGTYLTQKNEIFRLKNQDRSLDLSPRKVESFVITNQAMITTQAINLALENNIDMVFLDAFGDPTGRIWFAKMGSTALIRRKQLEMDQNDSGLMIVKDLIKNKIGNQVKFLKTLKNARPGKEHRFIDTILAIEKILQTLEVTDGENVIDLRNTIMGLEGTSARAYFKVLARAMPEKYRFKGRSRRPAKDPFNAVLNYCYGMLYGKVEKACIIAGLDPFIGFLHTDNYNKKSLVFDLIEPFRIFAETTAVYLFTGRKMKDDYFDMYEHSVSLNKNGKPVVVEAMDKHLEEKVRYRRKNVKRRHILHHEAHRLANYMIDDDKMKKPDWLSITEF